LLYLTTAVYSTNKKNMKKYLLSLLTLLTVSTGFSQDCFLRLQKAFDERGANAVADDMHRNVIISFFEDGTSYCISGKVRVENGAISTVFLMYEDNTYEFMEKKFYNQQKEPALIVNGISEMIFTEDGEKFKVVFIDQLKPKKKSYKSIALPDDL